MNLHASTRWPLCIRALALALPLLAAANRAGAQAPAAPEVLSDREVELHGLPPMKAAYNPSIVPWGDGALLAFRVDGSEGQHSTRIGIVALDGSFQQVGAPSLLELRPAGMLRHTAEDPRLLWHEGELFVVYNFTATTQQETPRMLGLARLVVASDGHGGAVVAPAQHVELQVPRGQTQLRYEKNWTPFVFDGALHFAYTTNPPHIMRLPQHALRPGVSAVALEEVAHEAAMVPFAPGEMRGGSPALWDAEHQRYAAFYHGKSNRMVQGWDKYFATIGFYTFSGAPPFQIEGLVRHDIEPDGLHRDDTATLSCAYPGGFFTRDGRIYLVYGWQDFSVHLMEIDSASLWAAQAPIGPG